ncbi:MAG: GGDEF domain-containing protein [Tenericutes bacterium]|nr:GGDEF domain-containing protein [Mycoplasmatota bacterium]
MFGNNVDMMITITIAYFSGAFILTIFFYNLYFLHKELFLKKWCQAWLLLTFAYVTLFLAYELLEEFIFGIYSLLLVSYAYMFLSASSSFLKFTLPKYLKFIMLTIYSSIILLTIFTHLVAWSIVIAFLTISVLFFMIGVKFTKQKEIFSNITGIIIVIFSIFSFFYPFLGSQTWFMPWGYIVLGMLGLFIGMSLIQIHFQSQKDEFITLKNQLNYLAYHDPLTDIYNRLFMNKQFKNIEKENIPNIGLLFIDLNNLKEVNDTFGHSKGDDVLIKVTQVLKDIIKDKGLICRFGGDEFTVIFYNSTKKELNHYKETIKNYVKNNSADDIKLSFAVGSSFKETSNQDIYHLLDIAEKDMYSNKTKQKE